MFIPKYWSVFFSKNWAYQIGRVSWGKYYPTTRQILSRLPDSSSSSAFPAISLGFTSNGEIFAYVTVYNPTIEAVTFHFHGQSMLSVFLLPALTRECQDLLSLCGGMHVCTDETSFATLIWKSFGGMESETTLPPRKKSPLPEAQRTFKTTTLHHAGQRAQHTNDWAIPAPNHQISLQENENKHFAFSCSC